MMNDLISRSELKKRIQLAPDKGGETWNELYDAIMYEIDNAPEVSLDDDDIKDYLNKRNFAMVPKEDLVMLQLACTQNNRAAIYGELTAVFEHRICRYCQHFNHGNYSEQCRLCKLSIVFQSIDLKKNE